MRTLVLATALVLLAVFAFLPSTGSASEADLVATTGIPVKLFGDATLTARSGALSFEGTQAVPNLVLHSAGVSVTRVRTTSAYVPVANGLEASGQRTVSVGESKIAAGDLRVLGRTPDLLLLLEGRDLRVATTQASGPTPPEDLWTQSKAQLGALLTPSTYAAPMPDLRVGQADASRTDAVTIPASSYAGTARDASVEMAVQRILFYGGSLRATTGETLVSSTTVADRPGSLFANGAWTGPGTHREETVDYFLLEPQGGMAEARGADVVLYSKDLLIDHHGYVGFPWAQGRVETPNETVALQGDQVVLGGTLRFRPVGVDVHNVPQFTLLGGGDVSYVKVGIASEASPAVAAAAAASGTVAGLGALAALVYFWPTVKYGLSVVLFPLYARVRKEETLDHKGRELLYELIRNEPGVSTNRLAKEVPFGWSTLTYHLRVLERNEAIVSVRDGRYKRFFDRQSGRYANGRKYILAVLKNDATFDIARYIRDHPGASQKEVAGSFQLSPSSVHWHVERLSEVGLVQKTREAHNVKYTPGEAWGHVTVEDLKGLDAEAPKPVEAAPLVPPGGPSQPTPTQV